MAAPHAQRLLRPKNRNPRRRGGGSLNSWSVHGLIPRNSPGSRSVRTALALTSIACSSLQRKWSFNCTALFRCSKLVNTGSIAMLARPTGTVQWSRCANPCSSTRPRARKVTSERRDQTRASASLVSPVSVIRASSSCAPGCLHSLQSGDLADSSVGAVSGAAVVTGEGWSETLVVSEPKRLRYRLLHMAGRLARSGRKVTLRLQRSWPWVDDLLQAFRRLRALPSTG